MLVYTLITVIAILNISGLIMVAADKHKARKRQWRIPEKTFFLMALLGASPGVYAGMLIFRHKTRHWYFMLGIPAVFFIQLALLYYLTAGI